MFKDGRHKKVLVTTMILILALSTVAIAANNIYDKKLTATHGRIKFKVDGEDVTKQIEEMYGSPAFVVKEYDSRSYVPVRAIAELMGMEVKWDGETHTAEIIDVKSKAYEEEIKKKDKEISELKKEIEELKKHDTEKKDIEDLEKKLNNKYGIYKDIYFDITLEEKKNNIDVDINMNLRDSKQERAWFNMSYNNRKAMIEGIINIISKEYTNANIYGSIYDVFYNKEFLTFNKIKDGKLNISYDDRIWDTYDEYIDDTVYEEFNSYDIEGVYMSHLDIDRYTIYFDVNIPYSSRSAWWALSRNQKENILDRVSNKIIYDYDYYYNYYYYDDYRYKDVMIKVYVDGEYEGEYIRYYNSSTGGFLTR